MSIVKARCFLLMLVQVSELEASYHRLWNAAFQLR